MTHLRRADATARGAVPATIDEDEPMGENAAELLPVRNQPVTGPEAHLKTKDSYRSSRHLQ
eukprot:4753247-Amphidinium_carterae.1